MPLTMPTSYDQIPTFMKEAIEDPSASEKIRQIEAGGGGSERAGLNVLRQLGSSGLETPFTPRDRALVADMYSLLTTGNFQYKSDTEFGKAIRAS